jgi:osmoprotectant transport system ATP-binding protein
MIRYSLQEELGEIFEQLQKTVLMVTHDLAEAGYFGDKIVLMRQGRIVQQGSLNELYQQPAEAFVKSFIAAQRGLVNVLDGGFS